MEESNIRELQFVDPSVSNEKFDAEVKLLLDADESNRRRGILFLAAVFPDIYLQFAAPQLRPSPIVFAVRINFSNYDVVPPSITFIDPFTLEPVKIDQMATHFNRKITIENNQVQLLPLLQQDGIGLPFLCIPGVREYHQHPAHTGDFWFLHRKVSGEGSLGFLVEKLYQYGIAALNGFQVQVVFTSPQILLGLDRNTVSV